MKYKIRLSNGEMVQIIADSDEEALQMAKEIEQQKISQGEFSVLKNGDNPPDMDRLNFNYQKGVALPGLRAALGFAEGDLNGLEEKEQYLINKVGSQGFTRDSKGNLALTPKGLIRLGITPEDDRNVVIDESGMSWGDVADLSGIIGPIAGTLVTMTPWGRGAKMGYTFLKEVGLMGAGAGLGKAGEELVEAAVGFQKQTPGEIAETVTHEALLMGAAQGVFGTVARALKALLGPKASVETLDVISNMMKGIPDPKAVLAMETRLGRALTDKELAKIPRLTPIPHMDAQGRPIAARVQAASETILKPKGRKRANEAYIWGRMQETLKMLGAKNIEIKKFSNKLAAGRLTADEIEATARTIAKNADISESAFQQYLRNVIVGIDRGIFDRVAPGGRTRFEGLTTEQGANRLKQMIKGENTEGQIQGSLFGDLYQARYASFIEEYGMINTQLGLGPVRNVTTGKVIPIVEGSNKPKLFNNIDEVASYWESRVLADPKRTLPEWVKIYRGETGAKAAGEIPLVAPNTVELNAVTKLERELGRRLTDEEKIARGWTPSAAGPKGAGDAPVSFTELEPHLLEGGVGSGEFRQMAFIPTESFKNLARRLSQDMPRGTPLSRTDTVVLAPNDLAAIEALPQFLTLKQFHNLRMGLRTGTGGIKATSVIPGGLTSKWAGDLFADTEKLLLTLSETGDAQAAMLVNLPKVLRSMFSDETIAKTLGQYQSVNRRYGKFLTAFGDVNWAALKRDVKQGGYDRDQLLGVILRRDGAERYRELMKILDEVDPKIIAVREQALGRALTGEEVRALRAGTHSRRADMEHEIRGQYLSLALKKSYSWQTNRVDPTTLRRELLKIGDDTLQAVMGDSYRPLMTALQAMEMHGAKLTGEQATKILADWNRMYPEARAGQGGAPGGFVIMEDIAKLAERQNEFASSALVRAIRKDTFEPDKIVEIIFKKRGGERIREAQQLLSPESFALVQQEAMRDMLLKATGPGQDIKEIFRSGALKNSMEAYGDDALEAMFGKEVTSALKGLNQEMTLITQAEGGNAGTLVAATVGLFAFGLANLQTIATIGIAGKLMSSPTVVRALARTDASSIRIVMNAMRRAIQLELSHLIATGQEEAAAELQKAINQADVNMTGQEDLGVEAGNILEQVKEAVTPIRNTIKQTIGETFGAAEVSPISSAAPTTSPISLPNVAPPQVATANPIVLPNPQDRFLAERLGRT